MSTPRPPEALLADAYRIADEILYPAAGEVDRTGIIPESHWSHLAGAGLFGIADAGARLDLTAVLEIQEVLTSGCLSTAFTWLQHHGVVIALSSTSNAALRSELLADTVSGRLRAGVAHAGVVPTPPRMTATRTTDGWIIDGYAPFVSGWDIIVIISIVAGYVVHFDIDSHRTKHTLKIGDKKMPNLFIACTLSGLAVQISVQDTGGNIFPAGQQTVFRNNQELRRFRVQGLP